MTPFQEALLAIEIAVDALHEGGTEASRDALAEIAHLGFDTRPSEVRKPKPEESWTSKALRTKQPSLFPE